MRLAYNGPPPGFTIGGQRVGTCERCQCRDCQNTDCPYPCKSQIGCDAAVTKCTDRR